MTHVGRYELLDLIARGGMGEVHRARVDAFGGASKIVALKLVRADASHDRQFRALFFEEVRLAMRLSHVHIVQAFDAGLHGDQLFLAMEHVPGTNLGALLAARRGQPLDPPHAIAIVMAIARALEYAHGLADADGRTLSIVHRDVSPTNVLLSYAGDVKLADFGIAKSTMRSLGSLAGAIRGKVPYIAPEQLRGDPVDARADLYSLGLVLYELLAGRRAFVDDTLAGIPAVLAGACVPLSTHRPGLDPTLLSLVSRLMSPDAAARPASASEVFDALERIAPRAGVRELEALVRAHAPRPEEPVGAVAAVGASPAPHPARVASFDDALATELVRMGVGGEDER